MAWQAEAIFYQLNIVVRFEDDGQATRVAGVWVHRRATAPYEHAGHTPTTQMRRVEELSLEKIHAAVDAYRIVN